ncbi:MAG TPA: alpha/beta hydrolase [Ktedonobacteraceae bacterium]|nr:alpha/beta hydrolase [Ktedonobacteraceae bacterium]
MTFSSKEENEQTSSHVNRRTAVKRIGMTAAGAALLSGIQPWSATAADADTTTQPSKPNILFVHGAFADGSSWSRVIPTLQETGHRVLAVQLPLTGLADDIATTRQALAFLSGPTVLVGHSYGGSVITGAGADAPNVTGLVYIAAYVPAAGESVGDLNNLYPVTAGAQHVTLSYVQNTLWVDPDVFPQVFAGDVEPEQARALAAVQHPTAFSCFGEKSGQPAWQQLPSWYLVSKNDQMINPDLERWMATRINATTREVDASHASLISHPHVVASVILQAAAH